MSDSDRSQALPLSEARRAEIADLWYRAVRPTGFSPHPAATVRAQFRALTDQAIAVVGGAPGARETAEDAGAAVVRLGYDQPRALGATLEVLARELVGGLEPAQALALQPRLSAALGAMASGFAAQSRATILTEQEEIRGALLVARQQAEERLRDEEHLRAREQATRATAEAERDHLQQILDVLPEGILIVDDTGRFVLNNRAATAIIGRDLAGLAVPMIDPAAPTRHMLRRVDGAALSLQELPMVRAILQGAETRGEQFLVHNAVSGQDVPVLVNSAPLHDRDHRPMGAVAVFQDITALKDLERTRELFLSAVSHDLKSPLTSIQGLAQLLHHQVAQEGTPRSARWVKSLDTMLRSVRSMTRLLDELRDVTRLQLGQTLDLDRSSTDLIALVHTVVERYQATAPDRLHLQLSAPAISGMVDGPRLERVVTNLVTNALKYSPAGGVVTVRFAREETAEGPQAVLVVQDQGIGIPAADIPHVFALFHRGTNVVGQIEGTGMGLASAHEIVQRHGGVITVESQEGVGTTFTVSVPLHGDSAAALVAFDQ